MSRTLKIYQGEDQVPVTDLTDMIEWPEAEFRQRAYLGEGVQSRIRLRDEDGVTGNNQGLPAGLTSISIAAHNVVVWEQDGHVMARMRVSPKDYTRGAQVTDRHREAEITLDDYNIDLHKIVVHDWARGVESDKARVQALMASYLSGSPRRTTNLNGSNFVSGSNLVTLPATTYDRTTVHEVLTSIATATNKQFFVTIGGGLFYDGNDSTAYLCPLKISDRESEVNNTTVWEPQPSTYGPASQEDGQQLLSGIWLFYGESQYVHVTNPTVANQYSWWEDIIYDDTVTTAAQATVVANAMLANRQYEERQYAVKIGPLTAGQAFNIAPGMLIDIKWRAIPDADDAYVSRRITELQWTTPEPFSYFADMILDRPLKLHGPGQKVDTIIPKPPEDCPEDEVVYDTTTSPATPCPVGSGWAPSTTNAGCEDGDDEPGTYRCNISSGGLSQDYPVTAGNTYHFHYEYITGPSNYYVGDTRKLRLWCTGSGVPSTDGVPGTGYAEVFLPVQPDCTRLDADITVTIPTGYSTLHFGIQGPNNIVAGSAYIAETAQPAEDENWCGPPPPDSGEGSIGEHCHQYACADHTHPATNPDGMVEICRGDTSAATEEIITEGLTGAAIKVSTESPTFTKEKAFDGSTAQADHWSAEITGGVDEQWIAVDLTTSQQAEAYEIYQGLNGGVYDPNDAATEMRLYGSNNAAAWTWLPTGVLVADPASNNWTLVDTNTTLAFDTGQVPIAPPVSYRYWLLRAAAGPAAGTGDGWNVQEWQLFQVAGVVTTILPIGTALDHGTSAQAAACDHVHTAAAEVVTYDNGTSGLTADQVQAAIDEVEDRVDTLESAGAGGDVGWATVGYPTNFILNAALTTPLALAANGGSVAIPMMAPSHMLLQAVSIRSTDTGTARTWGWDLYLQDTNTGDSAENTVARVATGSADESFTPGGASTRTIDAASAPVYLPPGIYWLVVQNRHATNNFGIATTATGHAFGPDGPAATKTTTNPNGATLDLVAATWTKNRSMFGAWLRARVLGQTTLY